MWRSIMQATFSDLRERSGHKEITSRTIVLVLLY